MYFDVLPRASKYVIVFVVFTILACAMGLAITAIHSGETLAADRAVLLFIRQNWASPGLDAFMNIATDIGSVLVVSAATFALLLLLIHRRAYAHGLWVAFSMTGVGLITIILKSIFARERPYQVGEIAKEISFSFPSGHSIGSAALATTAVVLLWHTKWRTLALVLGTLYLVFVGFSRMYVGVHYPTDVVIGWLIGIAWVVVTFWVFRSRKRSFRNPS